MQNGHQDRFKFKAVSYHKIFLRLVRFLSRKKIMTRKNQTYAFQELIETDKSSI